MIRRKHIIITGGAGFIGSHIASRLISEGYRVTVLDNLFSGKKGNMPRGAAFIKVDLSRKGSYSRLKGITCDAVLHLAGQSSGEASFDDPLYDLHSHVFSTFWMLEWCKRMGISRFIYASSMSVYGDPSYLPVDEAHPMQPKTFYAAGKIAAEAYVKLYQTLGINTTIFRLFSVYGPGQDLGNKKQGMVSIFLSYMLEGLPITVKGAKDRFRDFIYIDDAVDAWCMAIDNAVTYGKLYNLASGRKTSVEELLSAMKCSFGREDYPVRHAKGTPGDQFGVVADIRHIARDLGWKPRITLSEGLGRMVNFEKRRLEIE